jgi:hypothetical protein
MNQIDLIVDEIETNVINKMIDNFTIKLDKVAEIPNIINCINMNDTISETTRLDIKKQMQTQLEIEKGNLISLYKEQLLKAKKG